MFTGNNTADYSIFIGIVFVSAIILVRVLRYFLGKFLAQRSDFLRVEATKYHFLKNALSFLIFLAATIVVLYTIPPLKQLGLTLFAGAGILAAILGFASQAAFSNIISGIFIVIFKPFRVGDVVKINNLYFGTVEDINLRQTSIRDIENKRFIIPNSVISSEVIHNYLIEDPKVANQILFGVSYRANLDDAMEGIRSEAMAHPNYIDNRTEEDLAKGLPPVVVRVVEWADSAIIIRATVWTNSPSEGFELKTDILKSVKERFDREGIEIPYPHRKVIVEYAPGSEEKRG